MMEHIQHQQGFNSHLKKVLKSYQVASMNSLSGPASYTSYWNDLKLSPPITAAAFDGCVSAARNAEKTMKGSGPMVIKSENGKYLEYDPLFSPPPFPVQQLPVFSPADQSRERSETVLENECITCFMVGGEKRLCLPQILNTVLRDFSLQQINAVCDELQIFCSRCNPEQLEILKVCGILPFSAPSCGLITKTDAERLCNALLHARTPASASSDAPPPTTKHSFRVYHECFGKCKGTFIPELYTEPHAACIACCECHGLVSPQRFVVHSHRPRENRTCHWGFDSNSWRSYVLVAKNQENEAQLREKLDDIKKWLHECQKSQLASILEAKVAVPETEPVADAIVIDGSALVNALPPRASKTSAEYATLDFIPKVATYAVKYKRMGIFFDVYQPSSLNAETRIKRGKGARRRVTENGKMPRNWQSFLRDDTNKTELFEYLAMKVADVRTENTVIITKGANAIIAI
ncbi:PREDICTED: ski oncogene-like [Priapulus caudatus]|uniref:Ski oncogene-like n=1 Tax=Priapulus caudatus TaxID=37621 RepID=A0ABM1DZL9_PRICU|nr:PREDICTED: ski oncogene-like [Priapulus caudatus]